jgi:hypothetical protein
MALHKTFLDLEVAETDKDRAYWASRPWLTKCDLKGCVGRIRIELLPKQPYGSPRKLMRTFILPRASRV